MLTDYVLMAIWTMNEVTIDSPVTESKVVRFLVEADRCSRHFACQICELVAQPKTSPRQLQRHHIAGKMHGEPNYPDSITVCAGCHKYLSDVQRSWLVFRKDPATRLSCYFFGLADIFTLLAQKSGKKFFHELASRFRAKGYHMRNAVYKAPRKRDR